MTALRINREGDRANPFTELADETWLRVTDDHPIDDDLDEAAEAYFRIGMLVAFQLVAQAAEQPGRRAARRVNAAIGVAVEILEATT